MNVLALQGGGCLGFGQALILQELEKCAGKPCSDLFECVAGTSVGSIIGALVATGAPASAILAFFTQDAPNIFKQSWLGSVEALAGAKYPATNLEASLMSALGEKTLADCKIRFIATAYDFTSDRVIRFDSGVLSSEDKNEIVYGKDCPLQLWQVCRMSSAAQTYFPAYELQDKVVIDGGNTSDNAPDMLAITELLASGTALSDLRILSLGSGDTAWEVDAKSMVNPSPVRAGLQTIKIVFAAGEEAQVTKAKKLLGPSHFRLSPDLWDGIAIDDWPACSKSIPPAVEKLLAVNQAVLEEFCE